ncbi:MAG: hypothetical protein AB7U75_14750 [Hyphomicrobiaceae bacterium]
MSNQPSGNEVWTELKADLGRFVRWRFFPSIIIFTVCFGVAYVVGSATHPGIGLLTFIAQIGAAVWLGDILQRIENRKAREKQAAEDTAYREERATTLKRIEEKLRNV